VLVGTKLVTVDGITVEPVEVITVEVIEAGTDEVNDEMIAVVLVFGGGVPLL